MTLQEQIRSARMRTVLVLFLFIVLVALVVAAVYVFFGQGFGLIMALVAVGYGIFAYVAAGSIVASASGARPVSKEEAPELYRTVENAAIAAGLAKTPDIYLIDDAAPNEIGRAHV